MSNTLPQGWSLCTLADIAAVNPKTVADESLIAGFVPMSHVPTSYHGELLFDEKPWGEIKKSYTNFQDGDVIFAKVTPCFENGKAAIVDDLPNGIGAGSSELYVLRPHCSDISHKLLFALIKTHAFMQEGATNMTGAVGLRRVPKSFVETFSIALPPAAEQKEITDRLDKLLAQVEATQARLARIPDIIKQFRQSVLAAAVSGRLTTDWIEQHEINESAIQLKKRWIEERESWFNATQQELLKTGKIKKIKTMPLPVLPDMDTAIPESIPEHWTFISVNEFAQCFDNMRIPVKKEARLTNAGLYPYFGANGEVDRVDEFIFDDDLVLVTEDETFYGREKPIAYRYTGKCWVNNHAHVLKAMTKEANDYLCYALMYYKVIPWLSGTTGRAKLTQAALNSLPIGLPPYNELVEIVRRVEQLFAYADTVEQQAKAAKERVDNLTQAILAKAFRGELTADWRAANPDLISGDNSAAALQARIQAERATAKPRKRASKPTISPTSSGVTQ
ncbi:restriction endonuclease subunit S [Aeromonas dhakensis]|uniref:restriction endonuclease subunit S n=1 Tax=Aeromonas dhakensis TaxID=196024 RepID=UPI003B9E8939